MTTHHAVSARLLRAGHAASISVRRGVHLAILLGEQVYAEDLEVQGIFSDDVINPVDSLQDRVAHQQDAIFNVLLGHSRVSGLTIPSSRSGTSES